MTPPKSSETSSASLLGLTPKGWYRVQMAGGALLFVAIGLAVISRLDSLIATTDDRASLFMFAVLLAIAALGNIFIAGLCMAVLPLTKLKR